MVMHKVCYKLFFVFVIVTNLRINAGGEPLPITSEQVVEIFHEELKKSQQVSLWQRIINLKVIMGVSGLGVAFYIWYKHPFSTAHDLEEMDKRKEQKLSDGAQFIKGILDEELGNSQRKNLEITGKLQGLNENIETLQQDYDAQCLDTEKMIKDVSQGIEAGYEQLTSTLEINDLSLKVNSIRHNRALNKVITSLTRLINKNQQDNKSLLEDLKTKSELILDDEVTKLIKETEGTKERILEKTNGLKGKFNLLKNQTITTTTKKNKVKKTLAMVEKMKTDHFNSFANQASVNFSTGTIKKLTDK